MIQIDLDADLNWADDEDRNICKATDAATRFTVGEVIIAGRPGGATWAIVEEIEEPWVFFRQISAEEACKHGPLQRAAS